jgi:hypothetical protein
MNKYLVLYRSQAAEHAVPPVGSLDNGFICVYPFLSAANHPKKS